MIGLPRISRLVVNCLLWIACLRLVTAVDIITTIAGSSTSGSYSGDNSQATAALLNTPKGITLDSAGALSYFDYLHIYYIFIIYFLSGNVYIGDTSNNRVRKVTISRGIITTIAGNGGTGSYSGDNGQAAAAGLYGPSGVAVDSSGRQVYFLFVLT